ncbi:MAG: type II toxin-antitoxin system VapC family toxin [Pseudomonadota bacterium]|nr:type II toxin-antitoxin system VapC family toxin [Pseudomonadota bacterium]
MFLIDTSIVKELTRRQPDETVMAWLEAMRAPAAQLSLSVVTVDDIAYDLARKPKPRASARFNDMLENNIVLPVSQSIARRAGELRGAFALRGQVRSQADMLIAATAQLHALTLVTRNVRDFDGCGITVLNPFER